MTESAELLSEVSAVLSKAGLASQVTSLTPFAFGGNNRTFRVETTSGTFALKQYFRHEGDSRDRLASEFSFLSYASKAAPGMAPQPLAMDVASGMGVYEFIKGSRYQEGDIEWAQVSQAADFFRALNNSDLRSSVLASSLPNASESCFSIEDHLNLIGARINRLLSIDGSSAENRSAQALIQKIHSAWLLLSEEIFDACQRDGIDPARSLDVGMRCISPSDFGFHNALALEDGSSRFLDFEYAGWDDPAKMAGDFFAQLAIPVPADLFDRFIQETMQPFEQCDFLSIRARLLRSAYQFKWCCIALNVFLPVNFARRKFANPSLDESTLKRAQLAKATKLFQSTCNSNHVLH